jgi:4-hydroxy-tetrahydrodipicolinate reductase
MKIALVGYGKMGHMIESVAVASGHSIVSRIDPFAPDVDAKSVVDSVHLADADVAIEFTSPDTALANIRALADRGVPMVVGTTGWLSSLDEAAKAVEAAGTSLLWASNFSLGVNLFYRIAAYAAQLADPFDEYDVGGFEAHHNKKVDSPSGTAKTLVERVLASMTRKKRPVYEMLDRPPAPDELHFSSLRVGAVPGTHSIFFDSSADTIEITHTARNREGLARGAVRAAAWLVAEERHGVFTIDDALADILQ